STHSATRACLSALPGGGDAAAAAGPPPPPCRSSTSTEMMTSSTKIGMGHSLTHSLARSRLGGEVLVVKLEGLGGHGVGGRVEIADGPLGRIRPDDVPGEERLVLIVQELDVDVLGLDLVVLDAAADPAHHLGADEQAALERELGVLGPDR